VDVARGRQTSLGRPAESTGVRHCYLAKPPLGTNRTGHALACLGAGATRRHWNPRASCALALWVWTPVRGAIASMHANAGREADLDRQTGQAVGKAPLGPRRGGNGRQRSTLGRGWARRKGIGRDWCGSHERPGLCTASEWFAGVQGCRGASVQAITCGEGTERSFPRHQRPKTGGTSPGAKLLPTWSLFLFGAARIGVLDSSALDSLGCHGAFN